MGYLEAGFSSYPEYLGSQWFAFVKAKAWEHSKKCCCVCGKKWDLQPHHLSYEVLGTEREWGAIRYLCSNHHRACTFILWFIKVPLTPGAMRSRYYFVKVRYKVFTTFRRVGVWMWFTYTPYGDYAKRKRKYKRYYY